MLSPYCNFTLFIFILYDANFTLLVHMTKREIEHFYAYTVVWAVLLLPMRSAQFPRTKQCEINMGRSGGTIRGGPRGAEGGVRSPKLPGGRHAVLTYSLHGTTNKPYVDQEMDIRTFYVTQDREKPTDSA